MASDMVCLSHVSFNTTAVNKKPNKMRSTTRTPLPISSTPFSAVWFIHFRALSPNILYTEGDLCFFKDKEQKSCSWMGCHPCVLYIAHPTSDPVLSLPGGCGQGQTLLRCHGGCRIDATKGGSLRSLKALLSKTSFFLSPYYAQHWLLPVASVKGFLRGGYSLAGTALGFIHCVCCSAFSFLFLCRKDLREDHELWRWEVKRGEERKGGCRASVKRAQKWPWPACRWGLWPEPSWVAPSQASEARRVTAGSTCHAASLKHDLLSPTGEIWPHYYP